MNEPLAFRRPDGRPLPPGHHLSLNPRGKFVLKLTADAGSRFTGKRLTIQLRTCDPAEAMMKRDFAFEVFKAAGILCRDVVIDENVGRNSDSTEATGHRESDSR